MCARDQVFEEALEVRANDLGIVTVAGSSAAHNGAAVLAEIAKVRGERAALQKDVKRTEHENRKLTDEVQELRARNAVLSQQLTQVSVLRRGADLQQMIPSPDTRIEPSASASQVR
jgi:predicted  nucleic acid-binding Zn-ribbon protein